MERNCCRGASWDLTRGKEAQCQGLRWAHRDKRRQELEPASTNRERRSLETKGKSAAKKLSPQEAEKSSQGTSGSLWRESGIYFTNPTEILIGGASTSIAGKGPKGGGKITQKSRRRPETFTASCKNEIKGGDRSFN